MLAQLKLPRCAINGPVLQGRLVTHALLSTGLLSNPELLEFLPEYSDGS